MPEPVQLDLFRDYLPRLMPITQQQIPPPTFLREAIDYGRAAALAVMHPQSGELTLRGIPLQSWNSDRH